MPLYRWEAPDDGQRDCPKHVELLLPITKNWNAVHPLVLFTRNLSRCTVIQSLKNVTTFFQPWLIFCVVYYRPHLWCLYSVLPFFSVTLHIQIHVFQYHLVQFHLCFSSYLISVNDFLLCCVPCCFVSLYFVKDDVLKIRFFLRPVAVCVMRCCGIFPVLHSCYWFSSVGQGPVFFP